MPNNDIIAVIRNGPAALRQYASDLIRRYGSWSLDLSNCRLDKVDFRNLVFPCHVSFNNSTIDPARLIGCTFEGGASFDGAKFPEAAIFDLRDGRGELSFCDAYFGGYVRVLSWGGTSSLVFKRAHFSGGVYAVGENAPLVWPMTDFDTITVQGDFWMDNCQIAKISFRGASFQYSTHSSANTDRASFVNSTFQGPADFSGARFFRNASFENARFVRSPSFLDTIFQCAPTVHNADLHQGTLFSSPEKFPQTFLDTKSNGASEAYRTLKLAMNKQHALAEELGFFLLEMRAAAQNLRPALRLPYLLYDWLSLFGQSVRRPLLWFLGLHACFWLLYSTLTITPWRPFDSSLTSLVLYTAIPFAAALRWPEVAGSIGIQIFRPEALLIVQICVVLESTASAILLFLMGLALRNMFRIR